MNYKSYELMLSGRKLIVEIGRFAPLANGAAMVRYGDTSVLVTAVSSKKPKEGIDFFPLTCEFEEKLYSVGKIPGGYIKREGRPSEKAVLTSRLIDRPIRPLFPKGYYHEVQVVASAMSVDQDCSPEIAAMIGSSIVLSISDIPFEGPTGAVSVGLINGEFIINPDLKQSEETELLLTVAGTKDAIMMVEAGAQIIPEETILQAILFGHKEIQRIVEFIESIVKDLGIEKPKFVPKESDLELKEKVKELVYEKLNQAIRIFDKQGRNSSIESIEDMMFEQLKPIYTEEPSKLKEIKEFFKSFEKEIMRKMITHENLRPDGRHPKEIRPISSEVGILPRTHGSGMFVRGTTSALSITTLGALGEAQRLDGIDLEDTKRFMHHYNFPPFSVGEPGRLGSPSRRSVGHGALGERALVAVLPSEAQFPYTIRVVSEVLSSNGSTSQASICASSLSMLDAGVPLKAQVAGIAMGLIQEDGKITILSDIQGLEDFLGDMDFKVAGTAEGVTAVQMDIKVDGLSEDILRTALTQAKEGRMHILSLMNQTLDTPRKEMSPYAPRVYHMQIHPDKIREVIGPGGKVIQRITAECNVKIDIEDDGRVLITAVDAQGGNDALKRIKDIVKEIELGEIYTAKIVRIAKFGAFVELMPGKDALVHISQLTKDKLEKVEDVFKVGDEIVVKVTGIDDQGKVNASRKVLLEVPEKSE
jgi:polyribonucleotide nucleotidyltransferase